MMVPRCSRKGFLAMEQSPASTRANQRRWIRFPAQVSQVELLWGDEVVEARVLDESFQGLGVRLAPGVPTPEKQQVITVHYNGGTMPAVVRNLESQQDGSTRLGLQWWKSNTPAETPEHGSDADSRCPRAYGEEELWRHFVSQVPQHVYLLAYLFAHQRWDELRVRCQQIKNDVRLLEQRELLLCLDHLDDTLTELPAQGGGDPAQRAAVQAAMEQVVQSFGQLLAQHLVAC